MVAYIWNSSTKARDNTSLLSGGGGAQVCSLGQRCPSERLAHAGIPGWQKQASTALIATKVVPEPQVVMQDHLARRNKRCYNHGSSAPTPGWSRWDSAVF